MEPEINMKMLGNLSEKLKAKFRGTTCGYSMVKIVCLDDTFSEFMQLEGSQVEGNHCSKKKRKGEKRRAQKIKKEQKPKDVGHFLVQKTKFDFCVCLSKTVVKMRC